MGAHYLIFIFLLIHMFLDHFHFLFCTLFTSSAHFSIGLLVSFQFICRNMSKPGTVSLCYMKFKYFLPHSNLSFDLVCAVFCYIEA